MEEIVPRKYPCKGEFLQTLALRYPHLDADAMNIVSHIKEISRLVSSGMSAELAEYGLTEAKFYVLGYLYSEETLGHEPPSPSEIADNLEVTRGTITGVVDGLERDGYVVRHDVSHDRRALRIGMTDKTRAFIDDFFNHSALIKRQVIPLGESEKHTLLDLLARIEASMQASSTEE